MAHPLFQVYMKLNFTSGSAKTLKKQWHFNAADVMEEQYALQSANEGFHLAAFLAVAPGKDSTQKDGLPQA